MFGIGKRDREYYERRIDYWRDRALKTERDLDAKADEAEFYLEGWVRDSMRYEKRNRCANCGMFAKEYEPCKRCGGMGRVFVHSYCAVEVKVKRRAESGND